jgi:hypothetical protein
MRTTRLATALLLSAIAGQPALAYQGTGLFSYRWTQANLQNNEGVWTVDFATGTSKKLWGTANNSGGVYAATFSPDGRQIAFASTSDDKLRVMLNDGSQAGIVALAGRCRPSQSICWTDNGMFWTDSTEVYRYVPETNQFSRVLSMPTMIAKSSKGYWASRDGRKAWCWAELDDGTPQDTHGDQAFIDYNADFSVATVRRSATWGHGNFMTQDGQYLLFDRWDLSPGHQKMYKVRFSDIVRVDTLWAHFPSDSIQIGVFNSMQTCPNNPNITMLMTSAQASGRSGSYVSDCWVWNWSTEALPERVPEAYKGDGMAMWDGPLPSVAPTAPYISLDRSEFIYWNQWNHTEVVPVTNTGAGTLTAVTATIVSPGARWLNVVLGGSGNSQTLSLSLNWANIPIDSSYECIVRVSGGGATNSVDLHVYKIQGATIPMIPEPVNAFVTGDSSLNVEVAWPNRDAVETAFELQRRELSGSWQTIATPGANVVTYNDRPPSVGTYLYRVRATNGAAHSAWSDSAQVVMTGIPWVRVTSPSAGQNVRPGDTLHVRWTSNLITQVEIKFTTTEGDTWSNINQTGGVLQGNPDWQNFAWTVPNISAPLAAIWVHQYGNPALGGESGVFSIGMVGAAARTTISPPRVSSLLAAPTFFFSGRAQFTYELAPGDRGELCILRLDGSCVTRLPLSAMPGRYSLCWDGRDAAGRSVGRGAYVARLVPTR